LRGNPDLNSASLICRGADCERCFGTAVKYLQRYDTEGSLVSLQNWFGDSTSTTGPLEPLLELLTDKLDRSEAPAVERRSETRFAAALSVIVRLLDEDLKPRGQSFSAVTRDISANGLSLLLPECRFGNLLVQIITPELVKSVVLHVVHCTPLEDKFIVGGTVSDWSHGG
jgi:hypothetical protein